MWGTEAIVAIAAIGIAIALAVSTAVGAVAVAIVGPRKLAAAVPPVIATLIFLPYVVSRPVGPDWLRGVIGLIAVPLGFALLQRFILERAGPGHLPRNRWVLVGAGLGLAVAAVVSVDGGGDAAPLMAMAGLIGGLMAGWSRTEAASGDRGAMSLPPT